ncbi:hypothetical protein NL676_038412 [Syzygium grande]|nr:hypothetical protein NL676_038412 [Syzygium grande]
MKIFLYILIQSSLPAITESLFKRKTPSEMLYKSVHQTHMKFYTTLIFMSIEHLASRLCCVMEQLAGRMPKDYLSSRSFKRYATHIINVERLAASSLLDFPGASFSSKHRRDKFS